MRRLLLAIALLSACGKNDKPPAPTSGSPNAKPETGPGTNRSGGGGADEAAAAMFQNVCSQCHGMSGMGDGPAAASLNPKPRNYTDAAWQASVKDEDIKKIILEGGQAVGKSGMMPAQIQLKGKQEVVDTLVKIIRGFGAKK
jgi:mono/diheme cytochrome c family protein